MSIFIPSTILFLIASFYAVILRRKVIETIFLSIVTIIGILYCFGLFNFRGSLLYGIYFILFSTSLTFIFLLLKIIKNKNIFFEIEIIQGLFLYLAFIFFSLILNYGRVFQGWDEFSHWGFIVKHFYTVDGLSSVVHPNYIILFPSYLPGTSLFHYFFSRFSNNFIEHNSYISMNLIYFSLFMPLIKDTISIKRFISTFVFLFIFTSIPILFSYFFYSELYVDVILGAFFGFTLLYYFIFQFEKSLFGVLMILAGTFMLTITKDMGILLAIGVAAIILLDILFFRRKQFTSNLMNKLDRKEKKKMITFIALIIFLPIFIRVSWANLIYRANISYLWRIFNLTDIINFFTGNLEQYQIITRNNFFFALFTRFFHGINITVVLFTILFISLVIIILHLNKERFNFHRMLINTLVIFFGLFCYQFILALLYVFSFSEWEAVRLASFERYTSTYLIGILIFLSYFFVPDNRKKENINSTHYKGIIELNEPIKYKDIFTFFNYLPEEPVRFKDLYKILILKILKLSIGFILLFVLINFTNYGSVRILLRGVFRAESFVQRPTALGAEKWRSYFEQEDPYFIAQGENGFSFFRMRYELIPFSKLANSSNDYSINIEPYYDDDDPWTFIITPEEWESYVLNNFKIVYIFKSDEVLENIYGHFFPFGVQDDMVYYVQNYNGNLRLNPVLE